MKKGEWYLASGEEGVVSFSHVNKIDWGDSTLDVTYYPKRYGFMELREDKYPLHQFFADVMAADHRGITTTRIKARDARSLLKLLQRKTK